MTVIDAHHHVWDLTVRDQDWIEGEALAPLRRSFTMAEFEAEAAGAGVTGSVLVQTVTTAEETPEFLALAAHSPLITGVVGWVDLTAPDVSDALAHLREGEGGRFLVGIRHQVQSEPDPDWLRRPDVQRGLAAVAAAGLAYDIVALPLQLPAAVAAVRACPQLRFVLDHLGKPPIATGESDSWEQTVRDLAALPNVSAKLSGLVTEADWRTWKVSDLRPAVDFALGAFGPERLMFGSDWPVCRLAASYAEVLDCARELTDALTPGEQHSVFAETATRVYGLGAH